MNVVSTRVQGICISYIHHYSRFHKQTPSYPLVLKHSYGKSPFLIGKSTINEPFSLCLPGKSSQNVPSSPVLRFLIAGARRQLHPSDHGEVSVCIGTMWGSQMMPSGKHTKNYGKSPFYSWVNQLLYSNGYFP